MQSPTCQYDPGNDSVNYLEDLSAFEGLASSALAGLASSAASTLAKVTGASVATSFFFLFFEIVT